MTVTRKDSFLPSARMRALAPRWLAGLVPVFLWAAGANLPLLRQGALFLAPFFLLLAFWTAGVDPEPLIARLRAPSGARRLRRKVPSKANHFAQLLHVSGGRLIAASLAGRAPPLARALTA